MEEVGHLDLFLVQQDSIAPGNRDSKVFEQLDYLLIRALHLLFEQDEDQVIDFADSLVDR